MQIKPKEQIIKRQREIEQDIIDMLSRAGSEFTLDDVKDVIYNEESQNDLMKVISMFDTGKIPDELENILELTNDAWNYFPHKTLKGLSPAEMMLKYEKKIKIKANKDFYRQKTHRKTKRFVMEWRWEWPLFSGKFNKTSSNY